MFAIEAILAGYDDTLAGLGADPGAEVGLGEKTRGLVAYIVAADAGEGRVCAFGMLRDVFDRLWGETDGHRGSRGGVGGLPVE